MELKLGELDKMSEHSTIKIKPLSNGNYQEWSGEMRALLMRSGLWSVVSGKAKTYVLVNKGYPKVRIRTASYM